MQVTLPPEIQAIVNRKIESGEYERAEDVVIDAVLRLDHDLIDYDPMSDPKVIESIAQADRGEVMALTDEVRAEIKAEARRSAHLHKPVSNAITY